MLGNQFKLKNIDKLYVQITYVILQQVKLRDILFLIKLGYLGLYKLLVVFIVCFGKDIVRINTMISLPYSI